jgi:hypothetical protein
VDGGIAQQIAVGDLEPAEGSVPPPQSQIDGRLRFARRSEWGEPSTPTTIVEVIGSS